MRDASTMETSAQALSKERRWDPLADYTGVQPLYCSIQRSLWIADWMLGEDPLFARPELQSRATAHLIEVPTGSTSSWKHRCS